MTTPYASLPPRCRPRPWLLLALLAACLLGAGLAALAAGATPRQALLAALGATLLAAWFGLRRLVLRPLDQQLARQESLLRNDACATRQVYDNTHDLVLLLDPANLKILDCNTRSREVLGKGCERLVGQHILELSEHPEPLTQLLHAARQSGERQVGTVLMHRADGNVVHLDMSARVLHEDRRKLLLLMAQDVTQHTRAESRVLHLAYHDTLTDLPNRTLLTDRVNHALQRTQRSGQIGALLFLDLDNFKRINDSLGHSVGDLLLQELARRLRRTLREEDTISRLGGDEFVVLLEQLGTQQAQADAQIESLARKIREAMSPAYHLGGHELHVTASIGYVSFPRDGETMETLLRHADLAMYQAKQAGRDTVTRFEPRMDEIATQRMRVENEVREALRQNHLELHFQPVLRIHDGHILGAEALLRWRHPTDGMVMPDRFLPQVEDSALMLSLADWVLQQGCRYLHRIMQAPHGQGPDYIAINIGHAQFHQPDFVERVLATLEATGADPRRLLFEITETVIMRNTQEARERMMALKKAGIRFAIDDFGTGYSSLAYLKQLPVDIIKIDKGFIHDLSNDPDDAAIVRTILGIANHMGLQVIAEGVEKREQLQFLRENGCSSYQGYLGRPPLSAARFEEELRQGACLELVE